MTSKWDVIRKSVQNKDFAKYPAMMCHNSTCLLCKEMFSKHQRLCQVIQASNAVITCPSCNGCMHRDCYEEYCKQFISSTVMVNGSSLNVTPCPNCDRVFEKMLIFTYNKKDTTILKRERTEFFNSLKAHGAHMINDGKDSSGDYKIEIWKIVHINISAISRLVVQARVKGIIEHHTIEDVSFEYVPYAKDRNYFIFDFDDYTDDEDDE